MLRQTGFQTESESAARRCARELNCFLALECDSTLNRADHCLPQAIDDFVNSQAKLINTTMLDVSLIDLMALGPTP